MAYSILDLRILAKQLGIIRKSKLISSKELAKDIGLAPITVQKFIHLAKSSEPKIENDFINTIGIIEKYISNWQYFNPKFNPNNNDVIKFITKKIARATIIDIKNFCTIE